MLTGCDMLARCSPCYNVSQDTHAGGVVGRKGDGLGLSVGDRVGHVGEGQDSRLGSRERSEGAEKESLGEHLEVWCCSVDGVVKRRVENSKTEVVASVSSTERM